MFVQIDHKAGLIPFPVIIVHSDSLVGQLINVLKSLVVSIFKRHSVDEMYKRLKKRRDDAAVASHFLAGCPAFAVHSTTAVLYMYIYVAV